MFGGAYVEYIHDTLVTKLWPGSDPVSPREYRNRGLIESAVSRPFHSAFGADVYPSVTEKAAALFHSLISNHPFHNGNKRTAVIALDQFLLANGYYLLLSNAATYVLAEHTASYKERGLDHARAMGESAKQSRRWLCRSVSSDPMRGMNLNSKKCTGRWLARETTSDEIRRTV